MRRRARRAIWAASALALALFGAVAWFALDWRFNPDRRMAAAGLFPANDDAAGWAAMPRLDGEVSTIAGGAADPDALRTHPYLTFAHGRFLAMWSRNNGGEFDHGYRVEFADSADGRAWSAPRPLVAASPPGMRRFARGFWRRDGELLALVSQDEMGPYFGPSLALHTVPIDRALRPGRSRLVADGVINNFAPARLASRGAWLFASRSPPMRAGFMLGGARALDDWRHVAVPSGERRLGSDWWPAAATGVSTSHRPLSGLVAIRYPKLVDPFLDEPIWWRAADGRLVAMFRSNDRPRLFRAFSHDEGASWTQPLATNFPDAISKIAALRLSNGLFVLASNPRWQQRGRVRTPLMLSVSRDGLTFDASFILRDAPTRPRRRAAGRKTGYQYPQLFERGGCLLVSYTRNGEDIETIALPIATIAARFADASTRAR